MGLKDKGEELLEGAADKVDALQDKWDAASEKKRKKIRIALALVVFVAIIVVAKCAGQ